MSVKKGKKCFLVFSEPGGPWSLRKWREESKAEGGGSSLQVFVLLGRINRPQLK